MKPKRKPFRGKPGKRIIVIPSEAVLREIVSREMQMIKGTEDRVRKQFTVLVSHLGKLRTSGNFTTAKSLIELTPLKKGFPEGIFNPRLVSAKSVQDLIDLVEEMIKFRVRSEKRKLELAFQEERRRILGK